MWSILGAVKTEFVKFETELNKIQKKLQDAVGTVEELGVRKRAMLRKLKAVTELSAGEAEALLGTEEEIGEDE